MYVQFDACVWFGLWKENVFSQWLHLWFCFAFLFLFCFVFSWWIRVGCRHQRWFNIALIFVLFCFFFLFQFLFCLFLSLFCLLHDCSQDFWGDWRWMISKDDILVVIPLTKFLIFRYNCFALLCFSFDYGLFWVVMCIQ